MRALSAAPAAPGWSFEPSVAIPLGLSLAAFAIGHARLRARSRRGERSLDGRAALFAAGWLTLAGALVSPLHEAGEQAFAPHMLEHEILMLLAAPLLVLAEPLPALLWALPAAARRAFGGLARSGAMRQTWRAISGPIAATVLQAVALWTWHVPALFDLALTSDGWHVGQHLSFLLTALLFWNAMLRAQRRPNGWVVATLCLFATSIVSGALGAVMAFSQSPWYAAYARLDEAPFGMTPMQDQQFAGLLMWIPGGLVHAGVGLAIVARALRGGRVHAVRRRESQADSKHWRS